jgi:hypothetical protein
MGRPEMYVGNAATKFDPAGRLTEPGTRAELAHYLDALLDWSRRVA